MKKIIFLLTLISVISTGIILPKNSYAQSGGIDLTVSPSVIELAVNPGSSTKDKIRIKNNLSRPMKLMVNVSKLSPLPESGEAAPSLETDESLKWITIDNPNLELPANEWGEVNFSVNIPQTASFSYSYAINFAPLTDDSINTNNTTKLKGELMVPLLVNVKQPGAKAQASIVEFMPTEFINQYLPVEFKAKVNNSGNVYLKPRGNIFIRSMDNKQVAILEVNQNLGTILPQTNRQFINQWSNGFIVKEPIIENGQPLLDSNGKPRTELKINWNKLTDFRFGKYTANLILIYDDGQRDVAIEGITSFWVIPYTMIAAILVTLTLILILGRWLLMWYIKKQVSRLANK